LLDEITKLAGTERKLGPVNLLQNISESHSLDSRKTHLEEMQQTLFVWHVVCGYEHEHSS